MHTRNPLRHLFASLNPFLEVKSFIEKIIKLESAKKVDDQLHISEAISLNDKDPEGNSLLTLAVTQGQKKIVNLLLAAKACPNLQQNLNLETPLILAAKSGDHEITHMLLEAKAEVNAKDAAGNTALMWAANYNHQWILYLLLASYKNKHDQAFIPNLEIKNANGETALDKAIAHNHLSAVRLLLAAGAKPQVQLYDFLVLQDASDPDLILCYEYFYEQLVVLHQLQMGEKASEDSLIVLLTFIYNYKSHLQTLFNLNQMKLSNFLHALNRKENIFPKDILNLIISYDASLERNGFFSGKGEKRKSEQEQVTLPSEAKKLSYT